MVRKGLMCVKKGKPYLNVDFVKDRYDTVGSYAIYTSNKKEECSNVVNGKVVAEFDFEVEEISNDNPMFDTNYRTKSLSGTELMKFSCLTNYDLVGYLGDDKGYAIHIKNLHIFDEPKELSYYYTYSKEVWKHLEKISQNIMYAYELLNFSDWRKNSKKYFYKNAVFSMQSQEMCRILNGEQTVLVRRNVLKEML